MSDVVVCGRVCFDFCFLISLFLLIILAVFWGLMGLVSFEFGLYFGLIWFSVYDSIRYDTTWFAVFFLFLYIYYHLRGVLIFLQAGRWLVCGFCVYWLRQTA